MYEIYPYAGSDGAVYVVDVQDELFSELRSRVVIPLYPAGVLPAWPVLNPTIDVLGVPHLLATQFMAAIQIGELGNPITTADMQRREIIAAIDRLFTGT